MSISILKLLKSPNKQANKKTPNTLGFLFSVSVGQPNTKGQKTETNSTVFLRTLVVGWKYSMSPVVKEIYFHKFAQAIDLFRGRLWDWTKDCYTFWDPVRLCSLLSFSANTSDSVFGLIILTVKIVINHLFFESIHVKWLQHQGTLHKLFLHFHMTVD